LTSSVVTTTAYGTSGGFTPAITTVPVGATVRFVNVRLVRTHVDLAAGGRRVPAPSPFDALRRS